MKEKVSVIMPFVNEYPQIAFTLQSVVSDFRSVDREMEIVAVNNYCEQVRAQGFPEDKGADYLKGLIKDGRAPYLKVIDYTDKLSHWNAKNAGVAESTGEWLLFLDAHVAVGNDQFFFVCKLYEHLLSAHGPDNVLHLPLSYLNDAPENTLVYRARVNKKIGLLHYVFHKKQMEHYQGAFEVPVMSSCGLLMTREIFDKLRGFPPQLGIYGGGENYINYVMAVMGIRKWVRHGWPLYHFAEKRGYHYVMADWLRNRILAVYLAGGMEWAQRCVYGMETCDPPRESARKLRNLLEEVIDNPDVQARREYIKSQTVVDLDEWTAEWQGTEFFESPESWC